VTGGASFIGSHVVEAVLDEGGSVIAYDNLQFGPPVALDHLKSHPRLTIFAGDVRDEDKVTSAAHKADALVHLAAYMTSVMVKQPIEGVDVNVRGTCTVLRCAAEQGIKQIVLGSSVSAYGFVENEVDETNGFSLGPLHWGVALYGYAKLIGEQFGRALAEQFDLNVVALRYATVYGKRQHWRGVDAPFFIRTYERIKRGLSPRVFGDGSEAHDYIDARDVAKATVKALGLRHRFEAINIATGKSTSLSAAIAIIRSLTGATPEIEYIPVEPGGRGVTACDFTYSTDKAARLLGFHAEIGLKQGLMDLFRWWDQEGAAKYPEPVS
jgi:UDP-glucose 4-epimerase